MSIGHSRLSPLFAAAAFSFLIAFNSHAERPLPDAARLKSSPVLQHLVPNPMPHGVVSPAEATVAQMHVVQGFRAELVLAEPDLHQPVAFAFDDRGRIWVAEAYTYPTKQPAGKGSDKLVIFADTDGDGRFEIRKVFAEGLNLVSGFEVGHGGVWVGAAPELLFIPDRNQDDIPDGPPETLLEGFGYQDTHECLNSFLWGPDGWLYGTQGVFNYSRIGKPGAPDSARTELRAGVWRYHPVRHQFEVFAHGGSNPWGLDYDERGQLFMTHCRSYWGRGLTTHVVQGGHYWNQANANHAPFIIPEPPEAFPGYRNYLLASARYDHGAGGAGPRGSDAIYGGHSHVGTMIYLGDNWPDEYRGHLFTHNLHGHQINHQVNKRLGSGFDTVHAGRDQFFCSDPRYVAIDLQYGPDGAVYMIDWYDQNHCHNPNTERWDRSNGRVYRLQFDATYQPRKVDLRSKTDLELATLHDHKNEWYPRTARRLLHERSTARPISAEALQALKSRLETSANPAGRLRALWTLHVVGALDEKALDHLLADPNEDIRAWAVQMAAEKPGATHNILRRLESMARDDASPVVRLYLASAIQRLPEPAAWSVADALARHAEDREDRNLPLLLWFGLAMRMPGSPEQAFDIATRTGLPQIADFITWYGAKLGGKGLELALARLDHQSDNDTLRLLAGIALALNSQPEARPPEAWGRLSHRLYEHPDIRVRRLAERTAAALGDSSMFPQLREALQTSTDATQRRHAFEVLGRGPDPGSLSLFIRLLDDAQFRSKVIPLLGRFDQSQVPEALLRHLDSLSASDRSAALNTLASRASFAIALLDAVAAGRVKRDQLTAFHVRQLTSLRSPEIDRRVASTWGRVVQSPAELQRRITAMERIFNEAPLWAYDGNAGRAHFQKLCAPCHKLREDGARIGPELTGAGSRGIRYYLENIMDPNAVVGADFQLTQINTRKGESLAGLVVSESATSLTLRTTTEQVVLAKTDIQDRSTTDKSLMPEGLLESLPDREQLELLKYLLGN